MVDFLDISQLLSRYFAGAVKLLDFCFLCPSAKCSMKHLHSKPCPVLRLMWYEVSGREDDIKE